MVEVMNERSVLELYADGIIPVSIGTIQRYSPPDKELMNQAGNSSWLARTNKRRPLAIIEIERNPRHSELEEYLFYTDAIWVAPMKTLRSNGGTEIVETRLTAWIREMRKINEGQEDFAVYRVILEVGEYQTDSEIKPYSNPRRKRRKQKQQNSN